MKIALLVLPLVLNVSEARATDWPAGFEPLRQCFNELSPFRAPGEAGELPCEVRDAICYMTEKTIFVVKDSGVYELKRDVPSPVYSIDDNYMFSEREYKLVRIMNEGYDSEGFPINKLQDFHGQVGVNLGFSEKTRPGLAYLALNSIPKTKRLQTEFKADLAQYKKDLVQYEKDLAQFKKDKPRLMAEYEQNVKIANFKDHLPGPPPHEPLKPSLDVPDWVGMRSKLESCKARIKNDGVLKDAKDAKKIIHRIDAELENLKDLEALVKSNEKYLPEGYELGSQFE